MDSQFTLSYQIGNTLYLNVTNRCSNKCVFCIRETNSGVGYNLWLNREPTATEILDTVTEPDKYDEIVFCGYGEPLLKLDIVKEVAAQLKSRGAKLIRVNTNGKANMFYSRNIAPDLVGYIDTISISLNAHNAVTYLELCKPAEGEEAYYTILDFARKCVGVIPKVVLSVVDWPGVNIEACQKIAQEIGADFRLRKPTL